MTPKNEPVLEYRPGTPEREALKASLTRIAQQRVEIPLVIGGRTHPTSKVTPVRMPHRHAQILADLHEAGPADVEAAIAAANAAKHDWAEMPFEQRAAIFLKAADLISGRLRPDVNAATMLGQSKTVQQAEIDSACEAADFLRFNVAFVERLRQEQPLSIPGVKNSMDFRPLDGFVLAIAPFNFTAIGINLPTAPALLGNTVVWKPASTAALSAWLNLQILREAGLPDGVINFIPGDGALVAHTALASPDLGGVHFTGSTGVFQSIWKTVGEKIATYRQYPRLVGETGGKDFIFVHASARDDLQALSVAIVRGGFEYQGQKCSACSRVYVPASLWPELKERLIADIATLKMGDVSDFRTFMGAVIDAAAFRRISSYLTLARTSSGVKVLTGGLGDDLEGYFVPPTLLEVSDPRHRLMTEEIFGPVVSVYVYPDDAYGETLALCDSSVSYALTGAIFARDAAALALAAKRLRFAAGNFYVNDKPTGAVVGQQPFGGGRASGTNDKAGSILNLVRWTSARTVKENLSPPKELGYPAMVEP